jgi:cytochrome c peroxidase
MSLAGVAYSPWLFWDGRADSLWRQVLDPMEHADEHGGNRTYYAHLIADHYREPYQAIFGLLPDLQHSGRFPQHAGPNGDAAKRSAWGNMNAGDRKAVNRVFVNIAKAIAAYERRLMPGPARFDAFAKAVVEKRWEAAKKIMTADEAAGLVLFIGKANCTHCHNGPLFTSNEFHNIGLRLKAQQPQDQGRIRGVQQALNSEFNCLGEYSDAGLEDCAELNFVKTEGSELQGAFRAPSLRNVADTAPYMHTGQFATLREVLEHYRQAPFTFNGKTELLPLALSDEELQQLEAFLMTLSGPLATSENWLRASDEKWSD